MVILDFFLPNCTVHVHKLLFPSADRNPDTAIRFSDPEFPKESNNLAIR